jgi:hypothetical protein
MLNIVPFTNHTKSRSLQTLILKTRFTKLVNQILELKFLLHELHIPIQL